MQNLAKKVEPSDSGQDDDFDPGSDSDDVVGVNIPVSQFQSRFVADKQDKKQSRPPAAASGSPDKDTLDDLLNMPEDRKRTLRLCRTPGSPRRPRFQGADNTEPAQGRGAGLPAQGFAAVPERRRRAAGPGLPGQGGPGEPRERAELQQGLFQSNEDGETSGSSHRELRMKRRVPARFSSPSASSRRSRMKNGYRFHHIR